MSIFVRQRSTAFRLRQSGAVLTEDFGPLHRADTLLEWASVTKTVTAVGRPLHSVRSLCESSVSD
ncbi:beta-lactamase family protein [Kocuria marina]|uniref:beta-lactamase family protein n=1 Tax=Kocuria marina TaxID=223184 RepID=UPI0011AAB7D3|nr:beta-lactamase family protein [Kocuria indica]